MKLPANITKTKLFASIILVLLTLTFGIYNYFPTFSNSIEKNKIIAVAKDNKVETQDRVDFNKLLALNSETVGWVQIDQTPIEYPVVQTDNNDYYLSHSFFKNESIEGAVFQDYLCDTINTRNHILYSHYMSDESMFGSLWDYQDKSYYEQHPIIKFDQPGNPGDWEIFSVYITEADYDYRQPKFSSDTDFVDYMNRLKKRSLYDTSIDISPADEVLTLSTCIYTFDNARFVVHARKVR